VTLKNKCHICFEPLLHAAFLSFHCGHHFHVLCALDQEISFCKIGPRKSELTDLKAEIIKMANFESDVKGNESFAQRKHAQLEIRVTNTSKTRLDMDYRYRLD
jgi:Fe-S-cluster formation regulator IscX/YfhJ